MKWFDVHKEGLRNLMAGRGPEFVARELVANVFDEDATVCHVTIEWIDGDTELTVADDSPDGFRDLAHAWTLFAPSAKKHDACLRGRFNLGEKLVLALARAATITTTTGRVIFDRKGRRRSKVRTQTGSVVRATLSQTRAEADAMAAGVRAIIPPARVRLVLNGEEVVPPKLVREIPARLATEIAGAEGVLRAVTRDTTVALWERRPGETQAWLHEMGIPVVPLDGGDRWHVNVTQKVPLTLDRDNVRPAWLRDLRTVVLNATTDLLVEADANSGWAREACKDPLASAAAVARALDLRFGPRRVAWDPSDPEANHRAMAQGYVVVTGSQLSAEEWANARRHAMIPPAGQVTPSSLVPGMADETFGEMDWTDGMRWVVARTREVWDMLVGGPLEVQIVRHEAGAYAACFGSRRLTLNTSRLGRGWFDTCRRNGPWSEMLVRLLLHEFAHHAEGNHLSERFADEICRLAARLVWMAPQVPQEMLR